MAVHALGVHVEGRREGPGLHADTGARRRCVTARGLRPGLRGRRLEGTQQLLDLRRGRVVKLRVGVAPSMVGMVPSMVGVVS